jgi:hypothetical protein
MTHIPLESSWLWVEKHQSDLVSQTLLLYLS